MPRCRRPKRDRNLSETGGALLLLFAMVCYSVIGQKSEPLYQKHNTATGSQAKLTNFILGAAKTVLLFLKAAGPLLHANISAQLKMEPLEEGAGRLFQRTIPRLSLPGSLRQRQAHTEVGFNHISVQL